MKTCVVPYPMLRNLRIRVVTFTDVDEYIEWRKRNWDDQRNGYPSASCLGWQRTPKRFDVDICLYLKGFDRKYRISALTHEVVHAVQFIFENYDFKDDELQAYLTEYILQYCLDKKVV